MQAAGPGLNVAVFRLLQSCCGLVSEDAYYIEIQMLLGCSNGVLSRWLIMLPFLYLDSQGTRDYASKWYM